MTKATAAGISDAQAFLLENDERAMVRCLQPGQLGADETLINALGTEGAAKLFGVRHGSADWSQACDEYNAAFRAVVTARVTS